MNKLLCAVVIAGLVVISYGMAYKYGQLDGATTVQADWDKENKRRDDAYAALEKEKAAMMAAHQKRESELGEELRATTEQAESAIAIALNDFAGRLLLSESRAGIYQRQANGSAIEQQRLARHAAELDRSLEEGRGLVRELRETLGQRDRTILVLGQVILNERNLRSGETNGY